MDKRGQVYILAALILTAVLYGISRQSNLLFQENIEDDFNKLSENYNIESAILINSLLNNNADVVDGFSNFTVLFTSYSKSQNPSFGLIYAFDFENEIQIGNFLSKEIIIDSGTGETSLSRLNGCYNDISATVRFHGLSFDPGLSLIDIGECTTKIPSTEKIWIGIEDLWYPFEIKEGQPQVMIVSKEEVKEQRKVFIGGEGFVEENEGRESISGFCSRFTSENACNNFQKGGICCFEDGQCSRCD